MIPRRKYPICEPWCFLGLLIRSFNWSGLSISSFVKWGDWITYLCGPSSSDIYNSVIICVGQKRELTAFDNHWLWWDLLEDVVEPSALSAYTAKNRAWPCPGSWSVWNNDGQKLLNNLATSLFSHSNSFTPVQAELCSQVITAAS